MPTHTHLFAVAVEPAFPFPLDELARLFPFALAFPSNFSLTVDKGERFGFAGDFPFLVLEDSGSLSVLSVTGRVFLVLLAWLFFPRCAPGWESTSLSCFFLLLLTLAALGEAFGVLF